MEIGETLYVTNREDFRKWLEENHKSKKEIWLIQYKKATKKPSINYVEAVEEALCFGWIDSLVRRLDDDRFARKFTPRKPDSKWSDLNVRRYERVKAAGLLAPAGERLAPTSNRAVRPSIDISGGSPDLEKALRKNPRARATFESLAPSYQRRYVGWIELAKREETKQKRIEEAIRVLEKGEKLGLK